MAKHADVEVVPLELWKHEPDDHDNPAAESYLALCGDLGSAKRLVNKLRDAPIEFHPAKDLLRSSRLRLLPLEDAAVKRDLGKVIDGVKLSPVLVVRGNMIKGFPAVIADGYHRMCASYHLSENESIPCRIVENPSE